MCVQLKSVGFRVIPGKYRCVCSSESGGFRVIPGSIGVYAAQE